MVSSIIAEPSHQRAVVNVTTCCRSARHLHPVFSVPHLEALETPAYSALVSLLHTHSHRLDAPIQTLRSCCTRSRPVPRRRRLLVVRTRCSASHARNTLEPTDLQFAQCPRFTIQNRVDRDYTPEKPRG